MITENNDVVTQGDDAGPKFRQVINGSAKPSRKSAPVQTDWTRGNVKAEVFTPETRTLRMQFYLTQRIS